MLQGCIAFIFGILWLKVLSIPFVTSPIQLDLTSGYNLVSYKSFGSDDGTSIILSAENTPYWMVHSPVVTLKKTKSLSNAYGVASSGNHLFVASGSKGAMVFDISDRSSPVLCNSSVDLTGYSNSAENVFVEGNYLFVADGTLGLIIYELTDPCRPWFMGRIEAEALAVVASGNYAYISNLTDPGGISIVDVSDKSNPTFVSFLDTEYNLQMTYENDYLFVSGASNFQVIDVTNKANPVEVSSLPNVQGIQQQDVSVQGDYAYYTNKNGGLNIIDITDLNVPVRKKRVEYGNPTFTRVQVSGNYAFYTEDNNFWILDVTSKTNPAIFYQREFETGQWFRGLHVQDNFIYLIQSKTIHKMYVLEFGSLALNGSTNGLAYCGNVTVRVLVSDKTGSINSSYTHSLPIDFCSYYGHGVCDNDNNTCICEDRNYTGLNCSEWTCDGISHFDSGVCGGGKGVCIGHDNCTCKEGYSGEKCDYFECLGVWSELRDANTNATLACTAHGRCLEPDKCKCYAGYFDDNCTDWNCFSVSKIHSDVCYSHGNCTAPDYCECETDLGYFADNSSCDIWHCNGTNRFNRSVCSGRGSCMKPDKCECYDGFFGEYCDFWKCDGVYYGDADVCHSRGRCVKLDTCECDPTNDNNHLDPYYYAGRDCEAVIGVMFVRMSLKSLMVRFEMSLSLLSKFYNLTVNEEFDCKRLVKLHEDEKPILERLFVNCTLVNTHQNTPSVTSTRYLLVELSHLSDEEIRESIDIVNNIKSNIELTIADTMIYRFEIYPPMKSLDLTPSFTLKSFISGGDGGWDTEDRSIPLQESDFCNSRLLDQETCVELFTCYESISASDNADYTHFSIGYVPSLEEQYFKYAVFYYYSIDDCEKGSKWRYFKDFSSLRCFGTSMGDRFMLYERCFEDLNSIFFDSSVLPIFVISSSPMGCAVIILVVFCAICSFNCVCFCERYLGCQVFRVCVFSGKIFKKSVQFPLKNMKKKQNDGEDGTIFVEEKDDEFSTEIKCRDEEVQKIEECDDELLQDLDEFRMYNSEDEDSSNDRYSTQGQGESTDESEEPDEKVIEEEGLPSQNDDATIQEVEEEGKKPVVILSQSVVSNVEFLDRYEDNQTPNFEEKEYGVEMNESTAYSEEDPYVTGVKDAIVCEDSSLLNEESGEESSEYEHTKESENQKEKLLEIIEEISEKVKQSSERISNEEFRSLVLDRIGEETKICSATTNSVDLIKKPKSGRDRSGGELKLIFSGRSSKSCGRCCCVFCSWCCCFWCFWNGCCAAQILKCILMMFFVIASDVFYFWFASSEFLDTYDIDNSNKDYILLTTVLSINENMIWISIGFYGFILLNFILFYVGRFMTDPLCFCVAMGSLKEFVYYRLFKSFFILWFMCMNLFCYVVKFWYLDASARDRQMGDVNFWFSILFPELLLLFALVNVLGYNGVSSHSHLKRISKMGLCGLYRYPRVNIGFSKVARGCDNLLEDFFQLLFLLQGREVKEIKKWMRKLSNSDEYGHLSWEMIDGMTAEEVAYLRNFFFPKKFSKENYLTVFHHHRVASKKWIATFCLFPIACLCCKL